MSAPARFTPGGVTTAHPPVPDHGPGMNGWARYRITVRGKLSDRFASAFAGLAVEPGTGDTVLVGELDEASLHDLVAGMRDLGLEPLRIEETRPMNLRARSPRGPAGCEDRRLAEALQRRDESAFAALLEAHHGALLRLASSYVSSHALAEEIVQQTWFRVVDGIECFEGRYPLRLWIFELLVQVAAPRADRASLPAPDTGAPVVDPGRFRSDDDRWAGHWDRPPTPWTGRGPRELVDCVGKVMEILPAEERRVVVLRDVEGWPSEDVGWLLGLAEEDQRRLLHRGRSRVRAALEERFAA